MPLSLRRPRHPAVAILFSVLGIPAFAAFTCRGSFHLMVVDETVVDEIVNRRSSVFLLWLTIAAAGVILFVLEPGKSAFLPGCPFRALTGFTCPGCGTTRGLHQLLHGNLAAAFQLNPFMILALPFLLYSLLNYTNTVLRGQPIRRHTLPANYIWALFGFVLFFWVFRNTPFYPFVS